MLRVPDSNEALLVNVLYVPSLGVNLLSGRKLCQRGLIGHFNERHLWLDWVRLITIRDNCYLVLSTWKKIVERRTGVKLKAVRLNNVPELLKQIYK